MKLAGEPNAPFANSNNKRREAFAKPQSQPRRARTIPHRGCGMKITVVGSGDAFGTGGRAHTCIRVDAEGSTVIVDFGAASMTAWQKLKFDSNDVDAIVISHLHGDHFGGLPAFLLHSQFVAGRTKPLLLVGPPGFKARLKEILDLFYPGTGTIDWTFPWEVREVKAGNGVNVAGLKLETFEVKHSPDCSPTGVRLSNGKHVFAYSGDTAWTEALYKIGDDADLFLVECYSGEEPVPNHLDWPLLKSKLRAFNAKRIAVTHMGASAIAKIPEMRAAGLVVADDGLSIDL
jgi:ribonuclease BN (tRNA processing enzyme)